MNDDGLDERVWTLSPVATVRPWRAHRSEPAITVEVQLGSVFLTVQGTVELHPVDVSRLRRVLQLAQARALRDRDG